MRKKIRRLPRFIVYGLSDPLSECLSYIGKSRNGLDRPKAHLNPRKKRRDRCANWVRKLQKQGVRPLITILEECSSEQEMNDCEVFWICSLKAAGAILYNIRHDADSELSPQTIEKLRQGGTAGRHAQTLETRLKISATKRGQHLSMPSHVKEIVRAASLGRKKSVEEIEKRVAKVRGQKRPEFGAKMAKKKWFRDPESGKTKMFDEGMQPSNWYRGRK